MAIAACRPPQEAGLRHFFDQSERSIFKIQNSHYTWNMHTSLLLLFSYNLKGLHAIHIWWGTWDWWGKKRDLKRSKKGATRLVLFSYVIFLTRLTWLIHALFLPSNWNLDKILALAGELCEVHMTKKNPCGKMVIFDTEFVIFLKISK